MLGHLSRGGRGGRGSGLWQIFLALKGGGYVGRDALKVLYRAVRIQKAQLKPVENQKRGDVPALHHGRKARLAAVKWIVAGKAGG